MISPARALGFVRAAAACRRGAVPRPRLLTYTVSYACNLRCVMCDSWKLRERDELALDEVERIFRALGRLDGVRLTGGEPFLRRDLRAIADLAVEHLRPVLLHVTTNGSFPERVIELAERRDRRAPLALLVSIDGTAETHARVRGRAYAYERALELLRALVPRRAELDLRLAVNQTVVDTAAARDYRALHEELASIGVDHHLVVAYAESATYSTEREAVVGAALGGYETAAPFEPGVLEELLELAWADLEALPPVSRRAKRYYLRGLRRRVLERTGERGPRCVALRAHMRMLPNGDVPTCQFNGRVVGNLRRRSAAEIWASEEAREQRAWVDRCAGCWAECEVLPNALYTLELFGAPTAR